MERCKLGQRGNDGEWAEEDKDELGFKAGRIHESEEMNVCDLEYVIIGGESESKKMTYLGEDRDHSIHKEPGS
jgi:hypothetical protein